MNLFGKPRDRKGTRRRQGGGFGVERLEGRELLTAAIENFTPPSLSGLIAQAYRGTNTAPAAIKAMVTALQSQLTSGPLADFQAGTVDGTDFNTEVASLVTSFQASAAAQLSPAFPNVTKIIQLQGSAIESLLLAADAQVTAGLATTASEPTTAATLIGSLTSSPLQPLNTPLSGYQTATTTFETSLNNAIAVVGATSTPTLTVADAQTLMNAETTAYTSAIAASLSVSHPYVYQQLTAATTTLTNAIQAVVTSPGTDPSSSLTAAVTAFDTAVLGTNGIFGANGLLVKASS